MKRGTRFLMASATVATISWAIPAHAQDRVEIQVYDSEVAAPMRPGIETHMNGAWSRSRTVNDDGELPTDRVFHLTFEPHLGLTRWAEVGMYFVTAVRPEGLFDYVGSKLRLKLRWPERLAGQTIGLALNQEIGFTFPQYDAAQYEWEIRPIIDFRWRWLYASFNPIIGVGFAGPNAGHVEAEPAFKLSVSPLSWFAIGGEYYAGLGPLFRFEPLHEQTHWLFGAVDFTGESRHVAWAVNIAVGRGLVGMEDWIFKAIVGVDFR